MKRYHILVIEEVNDEGEHFLEVYKKAFEEESDLYPILKDVKEEYLEQYPNLVFDDDRERRFDGYEEMSPVRVALYILSVEV